MSDNKRKHDTQANASCLPTDKGKSFIGPSRPNCIGSIEEHEESEDEFVGPSLPTEEAMKLAEDNQQASKMKLFEERAVKPSSQIKTEAKEVNARESWMLFPPTNVGPSSDPLKLKSRSFRQKPEVGQFDPSWTTTPENDELKSPLHPTRVEKPQDKEYIDLTVKREKIDGFIEENKQSLIDIHREVNIKDRLAFLDSEIKRPFDREKDLNFKRIDDSKTKNLIKDAPRDLNSRFSSSKASLNRGPSRH